MKETVKETISFYDNIAERTFANWKDDRTLLPVLQGMLSRLPDRPHILDLGCGTGVESRRLVDNGADVTGVDLSERSIGFARGHVPEAEFIIADILDMAFSENTFDGVLDAGTLFHFTGEDQDIILAKIACALKENGIFLSFYPCGDSEGMQEIEVDHVVYKRYVRHCTHDAWIEQVMKHGFRKYHKVEFEYHTFKATEFYA
ncbi:MAG: class I SAM-dependent methyltransferase [Spirochaetales bacterium]|nr:class I SAM-dependent methyltransferase [Spirochaetales bacterium]